MILSLVNRIAAVAFIFVAIGGASLAASYRSAAVTGQTVTSVNTPTGQFKAQPYRKWVEQGSDGGSFTFDEQNRDAWSVYLSDPSRGVRLQIDLHRKQIFYADTTAPQMRPLYGIVGSSSEVNGRNVLSVWMPSGQYRMTGAGAWVEQGNNGATFNFVEESRDDWSVYLSDGSRGVRLQLDLHRRQVFYADASAPDMRPLYAITGMSAVQ
ncbi:MAG: hypothetical protein ABL973_19025 [Micropepsaceae bacterium]